MIQSRRSVTVWPKAVRISGGWFVAAGPGLGAGSLTREVSLLDLAPTFTRMLGVELRDVDGRPIPELIAGVTPGNAA